jgi:hypothetical protein
MASTELHCRGARGRGIGHRSSPGFRGELGWAGCAPGGPTWPLGRWVRVRWPVTPTGTGGRAPGTGDRGWLLGSGVP